MYERMLEKQKEPTIEEMAAHCGDSADLFTYLNEWLSSAYNTVQAATFPYGNHYGWGIAHRKGKKLICNVFAEADAFTVMIRLSNKQYESVYGEVKKYARDLIDQKYPCGDGGWIHYRVTCREQLEDIQKLLAVKCA